MPSSRMNRDTQGLPVRPFDTIVISDLHLGARNARHSDLLKFLDAVETDHLILNGDVFEDARLRGLGPADVSVVDALRQYGEHTDLTWLVGNHDPESSWYEGLLGIPVREEVVLDVGESRYLVCHGHQWDRSLMWPKFIITSAEYVYRGCQIVDKSHRIARYLKRGSKWFVRAVQSLQRRARVAAVRRRLDGVILGHTHVVADLDADGIHYLNSGCWTESPASFVGIRDGEARAYHWSAGKFAAVVAQPLRPQRRSAATLLAG